jgi:two-component system sensor histidine kinase KdpD
MAAPSSGARLQAPDLNATLSSAPALVDELAHASPRGSRNAKRRSNIEDLLKAVLDDELKTQHLESSSDLISGIMELP